MGCTVLPVGEAIGLVIGRARREDICAWGDLTLLHRKQVTTCLRFALFSLGLLQLL